MKSQCLDEFPESITIITYHGYTVSVQQPTLTIMFLCVLYVLIFSQLCYGFSSLPPWLFGRSLWMTTSLWMSCAKWPGTSVLQFWEGRKSCKMWVELYCFGRYLEICYFLGGSFIYYLQRSMTWPNDPSWRRSIFCTDLCFFQNEMMAMDIDTVIRSKPTMFTWAIHEMKPGSTNSLSKEPHQLVAEGTWSYKVWWYRPCLLKFLLAIGVRYLEFV